MTSKISIEKLRSLSGKQPIYNDFNIPVSNIKFEKITKNHYNQIIWLQKELKVLKWDLKKALIENEWNIDRIVKAERELTETKKQLILTKKWFWGFICVFVFIFIWWVIEAFFRLAPIKYEYIKQTKDTQNKLQLFQKEINICKENNNDFEKEVEKEVERQINNIIIRYWLNKKD